VFDQSRSNSSADNVFQFALFRYQAIILYVPFYPQVLLTSLLEKNDIKLLENAEPFLSLVITPRTILRQPKIATVAKKCPVLYHNMCD